MAWTFPRTAGVGDVYTATWYNVHTRDNLRESAAARVTTAGDMVVATGANVLKRVAAMNSGDRLLLSRGGTGAGTVVGARTAFKLVSLTQAEYDALATPDPETWYFARP